MPQLDLAIWYMLVCSTTFLFWTVYVLSLIIYREFINSQGYIMKLKQLLIYSVSSVLAKFIIIFKSFFRFNNKLVIEEIWNFFSLIPQLNWNTVLQNIFLYSFWKNYNEFYNSYVFIIKFNWFHNFFYETVRFSLIENIITTFNVFNSTKTYSFEDLSSVVYNFWRDKSSGLSFFIIFQSILLSLNSYALHINLLYHIETVDNNKIDIISFDHVKDIE